MRFILNTWLGLTTINYGLILVTFGFWGIVPFVLMSMAISEPGFTGQFFMSLAWACNVIHALALSIIEENEEHNKPNHLRKY